MAVMLLTRRSRWPLIVASIVVAEIVIDLKQGSAFGAALGYALANAVEPVVGASLVRTWCGGRPDLSQRKDLMKFAAGAMVVGPLAGGAIGAAVIATNFGRRGVSRHCDGGLATCSVCSSLVRRSSCGRANGLPCGRGGSRRRRY